MERTYDLTDEEHGLILEGLRVLRDMALERAGGMADRKLSRKSGAMQAAIMEGLPHMEAARDIAELIRRLGGEA